MESKSDWTIVDVFCDTGGTERAEKVDVNSSKVTSPIGIDIR